MNIFKNLFQQKPKTDLTRYSHIFHELYNQPVAILNDDLITDLEHSLINANYYNEKNNASYENFPMPYTINSIGIIPIKGILLSSCTPEEMGQGATGVDQIRLWIDEAINDSTMQGIIFSVNSGGGSISGINGLAEYIAEKKTVKPMTCFVDGDCCSAAYWIMASIPINLTYTSQAGGIGVSFTIKDESQMYKNMGVEVIQFKSSEYKGQGVSGVAITPQYKEQLQKKAIQIGTRFNNFVTKYRQLKDPETALNGLAFLDEEAISLGLADGIVRDISELTTTFNV